MYIYSFLSHIYIDLTIHILRIYFQVLCCRFPLWAVCSFYFAAEVDQKIRDTVGELQACNRGWAYSVNKEISVEWLYIRIMWILLGMTPPTFYSCAHFLSLHLAGTILNLAVIASMQSLEFMTQHSVGTKKL